MNVYLGPNQSLMKNAYIGEVFEYSYDFRGKSTTIITNDGWAYNAGDTPSFGTYGIYANVLRVSRDISQYISNAKRITLEMECTVSGSQCSLRTAKTVTSSTRDGLTGISVNSGANLYTFSVYDSSTDFSGLANGTYTQKGIVDLENKVWTMYTSGKATQTGTLTDKQVSNIINNTTKLFVFVSGNTSNHGIATVHIVIEY